MAFVLLYPFGFFKWVKHRPRSAWVSCSIGFLLNIRRKLDEKFLKNVSMGFWDDGNRG